MVLARLRYVRVPDLDLVLVALLDERPYVRQNLLWTVIRKEFYHKQRISIHIVLDLSVEQVPIHQLSPFDVPEDVSLLERTVALQCVEIRSESLQGFNYRKNKHACVCMHVHT